MIQALRDETPEMRDGASDALANLGKLAVPALVAALQNPDLYIREGAIAALAKYKPLPDDAVRALTVCAFKDKSHSVREAAADVLSDAKIPAGDAASAQLQKDNEAVEQAKKIDESKRRYSKEEILASIPADAEHEYPMELESSLPVDDGNFLVTLHQGEDRGERLVIWKKTDESQYRRIRVIETDNPDWRISPPTLFTFKGQPPGEQVDFLYLASFSRRYSEQTLLAVDKDADELRPVQIQSPRAWYFPRLQLGETIVGYNSRLFVDGKAPGFEFYVTTPNEPSSHASIHVVGTYKIVRESHPSRRPDKPPVNTWIFVPATAELKPMPPH
jgi:hypothetical protein